MNTPARPKRERIRCTRSVMLAVAVAALAQLPAGDIAHAQGTVLFADDWRTTDDAQFPRSMTLVKGRAAVATRGGTKFLRVDERADVDIVLPRTLPDDFVVEFDMLVPHSTSYWVEIRAGVPGERPDYRGASLRERFVTAQCGAIMTGVYGTSLNSNRVRQADSLARSVQRCRAAVTGRRVEVSFAASGPVAADDIDFGRTETIRLVIPATTGQEAYIGGIRVTSRSADAESRDVTGATTGTEGGTTSNDPGMQAGTLTTRLILEGGPLSAPLIIPLLDARAVYPGGVAASAGPQPGAPSHVEVVLADHQDAPGIAQFLAAGATFRRATAELYAGGALVREIKLGQALFSSLNGPPATVLNYEAALAFTSFEIVEH